MSCIFVRSETFQTALVYLDPYKCGQGVITKKKTFKKH